MYRQDRQHRHPHRAAGCGAQAREASVDFHAGPEPRGVGHDQQPSPGSRSGRGRARAWAGAVIDRPGLAEPQPIEEERRPSSRRTGERHGDQPTVPGGPPPPDPPIGDGAAPRGKASRTASSAREGELQEDVGLHVPHSALDPPHSGSRSEHSRDERLRNACRPLGEHALSSIRSDAAAAQARLHEAAGGRGPGPHHGGADRHAVNQKVPPGDPAS